ncbi:MAG: CmpA/NrtA family ABC transporter substrate-binding protein [Pseudomonadota bacterium]
MTKLSLGFVPLTDAAPLIVAKERGFFVQVGLDVELVREQAWSSLRDKLVHGVLDGAQALAPMPLAMSLGLDTPSAAMRAPLVLSRNGNGITLRADIDDALKRGAQRPPELQAPGGAPGPGLRPLVDARRASSERPLTFAVVFPWSCHRYQLHDWLRAAGLDPVRDVAIVVVPPPRVADALAAGQIDGFCAGEPWNRLAVTSGVGRLATTGLELWPDAMEKVLAFRACWADANDDVVQRLLQALLRAGTWLEPLDHRLEAASMLAAEPYLDQPPSLIAMSLLGLVQSDRNDPGRYLAAMHRFCSPAWAAPVADDVERLVRAMRDAGDVEATRAVDWQAVYGGPVLDAARAIEA